MSRFRIIRAVLTFDSSHGAFRHRGIPLCTGPPCVRPMDDRMSATAERGAQSAYGRRRPLETKARITAYRALRVAGSRYQRAFPDYLEFAPGVRDETEFADLSARVNCYLRGIDIPLYLPGPHFALRPELVPHFDRRLWWIRLGATNGRMARRSSSCTASRRRPCRRIASSRSTAWTVAETLSRRSEERYFDLRNAVSWPTYEPIEVALRSACERVGPGVTRSCSRPGHPRRSQISTTRPT